MRRRIEVEVRIDWRGIGPQWMRPLSQTMELLKRAHGWALELVRAEGANPAELVWFDDDNTLERVIRVSGTIGAPRREEANGL